MRVYPILRDGETMAFEIDSHEASLRTVARLVGALPGVANVSKPSVLGDLSGQHLQFDYYGIRCIVEEPFGDNSRYWVGPKEPERDRIDVSPLCHALAAFKPPFYRRRLSDLWRPVDAE